MQSDQGLLYSIPGRFNVFEIKILANRLAVWQTWYKPHRPIFSLCGFYKTCTLIVEPRYEKTGFSNMRKKAADQLRSNFAADQRLRFRYMDTKIPLLSKSGIPSS